MFIGFIFTQAASFPSATSNTLIGRYTKAARMGIYPFVGFLLTTILAIAWLLWPNHCLFSISVGLFAILVVWTGVYGVLISYRYL